MTLRGLGKTMIGTLLVATVCSAIGTPPAYAQVPQVRFVYLVPSDRVPDPEYVAAIERAARSIQIWYRNAMGDGTTFAIRDQVVETVVMPHPAAYYGTNPNGDFALWFWNNVLADGFTLTGGRFNDPQNRWIFYVDADGQCGQAIGGTSGVALLGGDDLRRTAGRPIPPRCGPAGEEPSCHGIGGLGHEVGHALNLPHPPGCEDGSAGAICDQALMYLGYRTYPAAVLLPAERETLRTSGFFMPIDLPDEVPPCDPDAPCTDVTGPRTSVTVRAGKDKGMITAKLTVPLLDYAGDPVRVELSDRDGLIAATTVPSVPRRGTRNVWSWKGPVGLRKLQLKDRAPAATGTFDVSVKTKRWFSAAAADRPAADTILRVHVGERCFEHRATRKID